MSIWAFNDRTAGGGLTLPPGGASGWMLGAISSPKTGWALEQAAQGGGEVTIPGSHRVDMALRHMARGHGEDALTVGLEDLSGLFQP